MYLCSVRIIQEEAATTALVDVEDMKDQDEVEAITEMDLIARSSATT